MDDDRFGWLAEAENLLNKRRQQLSEKFPPSALRTRTDRRSRRRSFLITDPTPAAAASAAASRALQGAARIATSLSSKGAPALGPRSLSLQASLQHPRVSSTAVVAGQPTNSQSPTNLQRYKAEAYSEAHRSAAAAAEFAVKLVPCKSKQQSNQNHRPSIHGRPSSPPALQARGSIGDSSSLATSVRRRSFQLQSPNSQASQHLSGPDQFPDSAAEKSPVSVGALTHCYICSWRGTSFAAVRHFTVCHLTLASFRMHVYPL
jgi:hypothetical protein